MLSHPAPATCVWRILDFRVRAEQGAEGKARQNRRMTADLGQDVGSLRRLERAENFAENNSRRKYNLGRPRRRFEFQNTEVATATLPLRWLIPCSHTRLDPNHNPIYECKQVA